MKYWKQFWGGLSEGWKRMHYIMGPVLVIAEMLIFASTMGFHNNFEVQKAWVVSFGTIFLGYFLLITAIYWIKEGFQSKEPTEEE